MQMCCYRQVNICNANLLVIFSSMQVIFPLNFLFFLSINIMESFSQPLRSYKKCSANSPSNFDMDTVRLVFYSLMYSDITFSLSNLSFFNFFPVKSYMIIIPFLLSEDSLYLKILLPLIFILTNLTVLAASIDLTNFDFPFRITLLSVLTQSLIINFHG